MKTYKETLDYLYTRVPMFQQVGSAGYKEGLDNTLLLDAHFGHPHRRYRTIHVAGTNGKGSCSHNPAQSSSGLQTEKILYYRRNHTLQTIHLRTANDTHTQLSESDCFYQEEFV